MPSHHRKHRSIFEERKVKYGLIIISIVAVSLVFFSVTIKLTATGPSSESDFADTDLSFRSLVRSKRAITCTQTCQNSGQCFAKNTCQCPLGRTGASCGTPVTYSSCTADSVKGLRPLLTLTFGTGGAMTSSTPAADYGFSNGYTQVTSGIPQDGQYAIRNVVPNNNNAWLNGAGDHTADNTGYMLLVNAANAGDVIYSATISNLVAGSQYYFSAFIANIVKNTKHFLLPNLTFQLIIPAGTILVQQTSTGPLPEAGASLPWMEYGIVFVAPTTSLELRIISSVGGGAGNDFVIDDIKLRGCTPATTLINCASTCQNDGVCVGIDQCACPDGYSGAVCETQLENYCSNTQLNSGPVSNSIDFGAAAAQYSSATPASLGFSTPYTQVNTGIPQDGQVALVNSIPDNNGAWQTGAQDHTPGDSNNGYMLLVNGNYQPGEFYRQTLTGLTAGNVYRVSVYLANILKFGTDYLDPYVTLQVRSNTAADILYAEVDTGPIPAYGALVWQQYTLTFVATQTSAVFLMKFFAGGGAGSDIAVDDIEVRSCTPSNPNLACTPSCSSGQCIGNNVCLCPDQFTGPTCASTKTTYCSAADINSTLPYEIITFDSGVPQYSSTEIGEYDIITSYNQRNSSIPQAGEFALVNSVIDNSNAWLQGEPDHTPDTGAPGYMVLVNADNGGGYFAITTLVDLMIDRFYRVTVYVANIVRSGLNLEKPNLTFTIYAEDEEVLGRATTGPLPETTTLQWLQVNIDFVATTESAEVRLNTNQAASTSGIDFVLDDISFAACPLKQSSAD